ncbi:NEDD8 ultimate buster 1-like [Abrus precatorius]|uniref:NEDD8 ultimate buster 1-like n=1 Tax=Abrus precatorius TaxID=3816 RepID=A0A8B8JMK1_ABRPR|nr:NEDD8 ultimate buster 1-like [Abrus precatorius]
MGKLKIGGTWSGVLEAELDTWSVAMLREEVAKRSNCNPDSIKLICGGRILKDGDGDSDAQQNLTQLGIKNNAKILATPICAEQGKAIKQEIMAEEERSLRLARVKAAATALAERHADGLLPVENFNIEVEDQSGKKVNLGSETDQRAIMMGLMFDANGKRLIRQGKYKDALQVLTMGEEAFSLCDPKVLELIDNVPILQINMVWCYFMIRDISWLSEAGRRLEMARTGIERAHGKDSLRLRLLLGGRYPELALHLRLELLEGVVAYHSGRLDNSREALTSAKAKFEQLQVSDEALSSVMSMGFKDRDATRALRMNNQDVEGAIDFLIEEEEKKEQKQNEDIQRRNEIREQKQYGMTPLKKAVDLERLKELTSFGFEKELAAEALRRNENDFQKSLDDLTNPETNYSLQTRIESRKRKRQKQATDSAIERFLRMGFELSRVVAAFEAGGTTDEVMQRLIAQSEADPNMQPAAPYNANSSSSLPHNVNTQGLIGDVQGPSHPSKAEERDVQMEDELSADITESDALADYDIEVNIEGEAITEYFSLLESATSNLQ